MAYLTVAVLRKRPTNIETFVTMVKGRKPFTLNNGSQKVFTKIGFVERSGRIIDIDPSTDPGLFKQAINWLKTRDFQRIYLSNAKENFTLSDIMKTADFGGKTNKGNMAEAIFGAAVTCRFKNKNTNVSDSDVWAIINQIDKNKPQQSFKFKSPNQNEGVKDDVTFTLYLSTINLMGLTDTTVQQTLIGIVKSSVVYANSQVVSKWAKTLYENNQYNKIDVMAVGTRDESSSKVDVTVLIDGKEVDINVSLKAEEVKQFGQVYGSTFDKQELLWKTLVGLDPGLYKDDFNKVLQQGGTPQDAIREVYSGMADAINTALKSKRKATHAAISKGIKSFATLSKPEVTLVQLTKNEAAVYDFENLDALLGNRTLIAKKPDSKSDPKILISDSATGKVLFSVRCRKDGDKIRNVIEKGPLLKEMAEILK